LAMSSLEVMCAKKGLAEIAAELSSAATFVRGGARNTGTAPTGAGDVCEAQIGETGG
jgi:hypothetical protein